MWITDEDVADTASGMFRHISIHAIKFAGIIGPIMCNCFVFHLVIKVGWEYLLAQKQLNVSLGIKVSGTRAHIGKMISIKN